MIINDDKGVKEIVASGKMSGGDIITDTNNITLKQNIYYVRL